MKNINFKNVNLTDGYAFSKQELNRKITIDAVYDRFFETKRIEAMDCIKDDNRDWQPHIFWDSDVAKWVEGASYVITKNPDKKIEEKIEAIIDKIEKNMWEDGYFNSYYTVIEPENRFTNIYNHELYCLGHLIEAAIAYHNATGKDRFLKLMMRYADLVYKIFYEEKSANFPVPGHEEIELALYKLYKHTGIKKYLELSEFFTKERGKDENIARLLEGGPAYALQLHTDIYNQLTAEGHSVRACYFYSGAADIAYETKDEKLTEVLKTLFDDIIEKKMYVTGGTGQTHCGEKFAGEYYLPSETAYSETCAGISLMYFADRMLKLDENPKYADIIEKVFYNNVLAGLSLSGDAFFYENPLEINLSNRELNEKYSLGKRYSITERVKVFDCSCCPPNLNRLLSTLENYIYYTKEDTVFVNQFAQSEMNENGQKIIMETDYPLSGKVKLKAEGVKKLAVRIPFWCDAYASEDGYLYFENPDEINLDFKMKPKFVFANENVLETLGKCAVSFGPIIYCAEGIDNATPLNKIFIDTASEITTKYNSGFGLNTLAVGAFKISASESLYNFNKPSFEKTTLKMIPYNCFANRGKTDMKVWFIYK